ncbi:MAG TPA: histidine--tRNA ligase [Ignavibacteria bacterium]|nr:histidine--tRNA ligase [Ignavibacteria bacterium]
MINRPKGTYDILPSDAHKRNVLFGIIRNVFQRYNYKEILTPAFEQTELFKRGIGEETDIVSKEMYSFDEGKFTLRPELTAPVIRAYLENSMFNDSPLKKLFYIGNMFRHERPQAGRFREFWQFGAEAIGSSDVYIDAEMIAIADSILKELNTKDYVVKINNIGSRDERKDYVKALKDYLQNHYNDLSETSKTRFEKNPLRILDTKDPKEKEIIKNAPTINNFLKPETQKDFEKLLSLLSVQNIKYEVDYLLVRGLDYYTNTTFEFQSDKLGAQNAILGGGRYDNLIEILGGKPTPSIGFACGIERLLMVADVSGFKFPEEKNIDLYLITLGDKAKEFALTKINALRQNAFICETDFLNRSIKSQMKEANKYNSRYVLVIADEELNSRTAKLKRMEDGNETEIRLDDIDSIIKTLQG